LNEWERRRQEAAQGGEAEREGPPSDET